MSLRNLSNSSKDIRIVFPHIQKTAGISIAMWISRHFYADEILYDASVWSELTSLPASKLANKKFVREHFGSKIINIFGRFNGFSSIALLRDPIERVISHFDHLKHADDADPKLAIVKNPSFILMDFLECPDTQHLVSNYQTANYPAKIGNSQNLNLITNDCWRHEHKPCHISNGRESICLRSISVDQVIAAVTQEPWHVPKRPGLLRQAVKWIWFGNE